MPDLLQLLSRVDAATAAIPRRARVKVSGWTGRGGRRTRWEAEVPGGRIVGHTTEPRTRPNGGSVVLVADLGRGARVFDDFRCEVQSDELAARGWRVVHFDAPGLAPSTGEDDLMGPRLADALGVAVARAAEGGNRVGVVGFGLGAAGAIAGVARNPWGPSVHFLFDVGGPTDRQGFAKALKSQGRTVPPVSQDDWWEARDSFYNIDNLPCPYYRMQPDDAEGGLELVNSALTGKAGWARLNDNAPNQKWFNWRPEDNLRMSPAGFRNRNRWMMAMLEQAFRTDYPADRAAVRAAATKA